MALAGDEKRIRALFSELAFEDKASAPGFENLWSRAEHRATAEAGQVVRGFNRSAVVMALAAASFAAVGVLAVWSWSTSSTKSPTQTAINVVPQVTPAAPTPAGVNSDISPVSKDRTRTRSHLQRKQNVARPRSTDWAATQAETLSRWQSPTNILMASPADAVFNSLPQLNESAEELKQFLPKTETLKESNQ